jgi:enoyl-CoA hydratase/carnithine racemase
MEENLLLVEKKERMASIIFNRPDKRNALSPLLLFRLADTLKQMREEDEIRCLVIRGVGDKAFSAGYDISDLPSNLNPERAKSYKAKNPLHTGLQAIIDFPYPVIAMINGYAFGGACELAIACDIRIAADHALLSLPPAKLGLVYHWAGIRRFINVVGLANAKEIFFTGRVYEAVRAREMGLVNYVVPSDHLVSFTYQMAREISENAPLSLRGLKMIFNKCLQYRKSSPEDVKEMEDLRDQSFRSEDHLEGQRAFKEKRKPVFKGR